MFKLDLLLPTLKEAFSLTKQHLQPLLAAIVVVMVILFVVALVGLQVLVQFAGVDPESQQSVMEASLPLQLAILIIAAPFEAGLVWLAWRRVAGENTSIKQLFEPWALATPLIIIALISSVLANLGLSLFVVVGIYVMAVLSFANLYYLLKRGSPLQAMLESAKVCHQSLLLILVFHLVMGIIVMISIIPFGLGLMFSAPMYFYGKALLFKQLFADVSQVTDNDQQRQDEQTQSGNFEA